MKLVRYAIVIVCLLSMAGLVAEGTNAYFSGDTEQSSGNVFQAAVPEPEPPPPVGGGGGLGDITPPKISNVSTSSIGETDADVSWETDEKSTSQVEYWSSPSILTPIDKTYTKEHLVHLVDLESGTTYFYRTISKDRSGNRKTSDEQTFTTLEEVVEPEPAKPEPVEPVIEEPEPEPEPIIAPAPIPPITPEPLPEEPEGINWLLISIAVIGGLVIVGIVARKYWLKKEAEKVASKISRSKNLNQPEGGKHIYDIWHKR